MVNYVRKKHEVHRETLLITFNHMYNGIRSYLVFAHPANINPIIFPMRNTLAKECTISKYAGK